MAAFQEANTLLLLFIMIYAVNFILCKLYPVETENKALTGCAIQPGYGQSQRVGCSNSILFHFTLLLHYNLRANVF